VFNATLRPLYPRECRGTRCTGGWVGHRAGLDLSGRTRPPPESDSRTVQPAASRCIDWAILSSRSVQSQSWPCARHTGICGRWNKLEATTTLPSENVPQGIHWIGVCLDPPPPTRPLLSIWTLWKWQNIWSCRKWSHDSSVLDVGTQSLHRQVIPSPSGSVYHRTVLTRRDGYGRHHCTAMYVVCMYLVGVVD